MTSTAALHPRKLDHCVLPVQSLPIARERFGQLGFTVGADGVHPFGTANCCIYFSDGTFLEPLALVDHDEYEAAIAAGNVFVARDHAFRQDAGDEGFSALVLASDDAAADDAEFRKAGISAGRPLDFSRPYTDAAGQAATVSFRLAFAAVDATSHAFFFTCQRIAAPPGGRGALAVHSNGAIGISSILAVHDTLEDVRSFMSSFAGASAPSSERVDVALEGARLRVVSPRAFGDLTGSEARAARELHLAGIVFSVADLSATQSLLGSASVDFIEREGMLWVAPSAGQGTFIGFKEQA
jgi:hypothetical protein